MKYEVWHGEWSLATDTCAHWLGGFNDGKGNFGQTCVQLECPPSYMNSSFSTDISTSKDGPHGPFTNTANMTGATW